MQSKIYGILIIENGVENVPATKSIHELLEKLLNDGNYNRLILPVNRHTDVVTTYLGLKITQVMELNMKDQLVWTNVWLTHEWRDVNLQWNPEDYGNVKKIHVPAEKIWLPDIVLYNNADGHYEVTEMTKAKVYHQGIVRWEPPAIYRSSCDVNVEFFPYDIQKCPLTFASWTYYGNKMILQHYLQRGLPDYITEKYKTVHIDFAADLHDYYSSVEFDVLDISAVRRERDTEFSDPIHEIEFNLVMRRKTLFYTVNLMLPCLAMAFLSLLVFYLPAESGEKISLSINILLSLTIFFQVLITSIPSTSEKIPLIGKYLLFTIIIISFSIIISVIILNVKFRTSLNKTMHPTLRWLLFHKLPPLVCLPASRTPFHDPEESCVIINELKSRNSDASNDFVALIENLHKYKDPNSPKHYSKEEIVKFDAALLRLEYIVQHLEDRDTSNNTQEEWRFIAVVIDRFFLIISCIVYIIGTLSIIFTSPALFDNRKPLGRNNFPNQTILTFKNEYSQFDLQINATF